METPPRITSSVMFVSGLGRSVEFYLEVFSCEVALEARAREIAAGACVSRDPIVRSGPTR